MKTIDLSKEKIKYVAIGDSISEGYNGRYNFGYAGKMDEEGKIKGTSWPSFLVRNIERIQKNSVEYFENFAMSGTRPEDWCYFLGINNKKYNFKNSEKKINFCIGLNNINTNPERKRLKKQFKNFGKTNQSDFDYFIGKIKDANLITINIGANYLIPKIPIEKISKWIIDEENNNFEVIEKLTSIINGVKIDLDVMLKKLKELNEYASIYLVGYNSLVGPFWEMINDSFKKSGLHNDILKFCCNLLNNCLKESAKKNKIYFITTDNHQYWNQNSYLLANVFYEIHPTIFGYKKIAQDVLAKMVLSNKFFSKEYKEIENKLITFNKEYILFDKNYFRNGIIIPKQNDSQLIEKIYGKNNSMLFKVSNVEESSSFLETKLFFEQSLDENNDPEQSLRISIKKTFFSILNALEIDLDGKTINNIEKLFKMNFIKEFILKTNFISVLANNIQNKIDQEYKKKKESISQDTFIEIILDEIFNFDFWVWLLKEFAKFLTSKQNINTKENKEFISKLIIKIFSRKKINYLTKTFTKRCFDYLTRKRIGFQFDKNITEKIILFFNLQIDSYEFISLMIDFYFSNIEFIKKVKTLDDLLDRFFKNKNVVIFMKKNTLKIFKQINIDETWTKRINKNINIPNTKNNILIMNKFYNDIINLFVENESLIEVLNEFTYNFMKNIKEKINLQAFVDFLFSLDKKSFWDKLGKVEFFNMNQKSFNNFIIAFDLIFSNLKMNSVFFKSIINLSNPSDLLNKDNNKMNTFAFLKMIDKLNRIKKPISNLFNLLINNYLISKDKSKENIYYKSYFRLLIIILLIIKQIFQKNNNKNIFMNKKISIVSFVFQMAGYKFGKNKGVDNLILNMVGEDENYSLDINHKNKTNKKDRPLLLIYSFEKDKKLMNVKIKKIFNMLKDGDFE